MELHKSATGNSTLGVRNRIEIEKKVIYFWRFSGALVEILAPDGPAPPFCRISFSPEAQTLACSARFRLRSIMPPNLLLWPSNFANKILWLFLTLSVVKVLLL